MIHRIEKKDSCYFRVQSDIINSLKLKDPYVAVGSFDRKNLFYGAKASNRGSSSVFELVEEILKCVANSGSVIIYCTSIKDVEQVFIFQLPFFFFKFSCHVHDAYNQ